MAVTVEKISYGGWPNCVKVSDGQVEFVVTTDVGPRVIRYGFLGGPNHMCEVQETLGAVGGDEWRIYGGHRLWHSPEAMPRSYSPDNKPVAWKEIPGGVAVMQDVEPDTHIQKQMEITLEDGRVKVVHTLTNMSMWEVELAVWGLTVLATGGKEVVPLGERDTGGMAANRHMSFWPYTDLADHRVHWGKKYVTLMQDPATKPPFKFGTNNEDGWGAYFNHAQLFLKRFTPQADADYPDNGCSFETYTTDFMLECESLSPLYLLKQGESACHTETWQLFDAVQPPSDDEAEIASLMAKYI